MRISDWSSDVCSSDLKSGKRPGNPGRCRGRYRRYRCRHLGLCFRPPPLGAAWLRRPGRPADHGRPRHAARPTQAGVVHMKADSVVFTGMQRPLTMLGLPPALLIGTACGAGMIMLFFRSEEHTSELQSLMRISYAVLCL